MNNALVGGVIQVHKVLLEIAGKRLNINSVPVILRGDVAASGG